MRFFSLIPAVLLAVTGFAAAAAPPTMSSNITVIAGDDPIQATINIVNNATNELQTLSTQLSKVLAESSVDLGKLSSVLTDITDVVTEATGQLENVVPKIDLTSPRLADIASSVFLMFNSVDSILAQLIPASKEILGNGTTNLTNLVGNFLNSVHTLANCLQLFPSSVINGIPGPLLAFVDNLLNVLEGFLNLATS